jgi:thymidine kinase
MLCELKETWHDYDVIAIDEGQFFKDVSQLSTSLQVVPFAEIAA